MQHFVVIAMPRSGSTRLCDILGRHPAISCHLEIFHPDEVQAHLPRDCGLEVMDPVKRDANPKLFLDKFLAFNEESLKDSQKQRHGFKAMLDRNQLATVTEVVAPDPRLRKIVLFRDNLLAVYASIEMALATGVWHRTAGADAPQEPERKIDFDWDRFFSIAGEQTLTRNAVEEAMHRSHQQFLPMAYEETLTKRGMERVWDFLNVPPVEIEGIYRRTYDRRLIDQFGNPERVAVAVRALGRPEWLDG